MLDDFGGSPARIDHDFLHSNFLADDETELVAPVVALVLADFDLVAIDPIDFVVVAVVPVDFGESVDCIDLDSMQSNFLADAAVDFLDSPMSVAIYLAGAVAAPFHFAESAVDIGRDLRCSNPNVDDVVAPLPFLVVAERKEELPQ